MEEFAAWVSGERADSLGSGTTTIVSTPVKTREQPKSDGAHGAGVYVALGTLVVVLGAALMGIPKLQSEAEVSRSPAVSRSEPRRSITPSARLRPSRKYASLSVHSTPRALLYVDGVKVGLTPITNHRLTPGTYRLRIGQKGYRTVTEKIVVKDTRPITRRYELRRQPGR
jgi:hypothetical protein